jgi:hypothetical protein
MGKSTLSRLLEESKAIEDAAERIQKPSRELAGKQEIDELISMYHDWYARVIDALPEEYVARFRDEFEGGMWTAKIKHFLRSPGEVNILYNPTEENQLIDYWAYPFERTFRGPLLNQRQILVEARHQIEGAGSLSQDILLIERICRNFPEFLVPLSGRARGRVNLVIEDEYDVQDVMHGILRLFFDDVRPEDYVPEYAASRSRVDFLLKSEGIVIEAKMTRPGLGAKEVGEQLIIDIARYKSHPDCRALVAFVYDPDRRIRNRRVLENDLTRKSDGLRTFVYIAQ